MKKELLRRLTILEEKKAPTINARMLRGGMQKRLHRQEIIRYGNNIKKQKSRIKNKLLCLENNKPSSEFGIQSLVPQEPEILDKFEEPFLRKIRNKRSFF